MSLFLLPEQQTEVNRANKQPKLTEMKSFTHRGSEQSANGGRHVGLCDNRRAV